MIYDELLRVSETKEDENKWKVKYGLIEYLKFDYPSRSDTVKKTLELNLVRENLLMHPLPKELKKISLDIGCATGRYVQYFARNGFYACGYDINDCAIRVCKKKTADMKNVKIVKKNILEVPIEHEKYSIVTSMMGTFNHIERQARGNFLEWVMGSLVKNGLFIVSLWNSECSYVSYLQFYTREEREYLAKNSITCNKFVEILKKSGFTVIDIKNFGYLPDICYEDWMGELKTEDIIKIDNNLRLSLKPRNSQMLLFLSIKY